MAHISAAATGEIPLGPYGHAILDVDRGAVVYEPSPSTGEAAVVFEDHPLARRLQIVEGAVLEDEPIALLVSRSDESLHLFDLAAKRCTEIPFGDRIPGSAQVAITVVGAAFVVVLEAGVMVVHARRGELWRIARVTYNWRFVGESDGYFWFSDADGNLLSYEPESGEEGPF